jgi:glucokinase
MSTSQAIVADIGGTNARFGCVDLDHLTIDEIEVFSCTQFSSFTAAFNYYQHSKGLIGIEKAAIAIAGPVTSDNIAMTNFNWQFSLREAKQQLKLHHLYAINDFAAQAMSLPFLKSEEIIYVGAGHRDKNKSMVVLGPGTGLGVAHLIISEAGFTAVAGEGGHVDWAAQTEQEWFIQRYLHNHYGHVSPERVLSGMGIENIYLALAAFHQQTVDALTATEITHLALSKQSQLATATLAQFFASLGSYAGDLALTCNAFGGVYIAGGIVPKLLPLLLDSEFRARFEAKGRFNLFNSKIATLIVTAKYPGLLGAAVFLKQMSEKNGIYAMEYAPENPF